MIKWFKIQFWKFIKWLIQRGYGRCEPNDYDKDCISCKSGVVQDFIDHHIDLIKEFG